jgi:hypothetical protein
MIHAAIALGLAVPVFRHYGVAPGWIVLITVFCLSIYLFHSRQWLLPKEVPVQSPESGQVVSERECFWGIARIVLLVLLYVFCVKTSHLARFYWGRDWGSVAASLDLLLWITLSFWITDDRWGTLTLLENETAIWWPFLGFNTVLLSSLFCIAYGY